MVPNTLRDFTEEMTMEERCVDTRAVTLTEDFVRFGGMYLHYSLSVRRAEPSNRFAIAVEKDAEHTSVDAGEELEFALECYRRIVAGIVTPCTLEEVMEDFEYSRRNLRKKLYKRAQL